MVPVPRPNCSCIMIPDLGILPCNVPSRPGLLAPRSSSPARLLFSSMHIFGHTYLLTPPHGPRALASARRNHPRSTCPPTRARADPHPYPHPHPYIPSSLSIHLIPACLPPTTLVSQNGSARDIPRPSCSCPCSCSCTVGPPFLGLASPKYTL